MRVRTGQTRGEELSRAGPTGGQEPFQGARTPPVFSTYSAIISMPFPDAAQSRHLAGGTSRPLLLHRDGL